VSSKHAVPRDGGCADSLPAHPAEILATRIAQVHRRTCKIAGFPYKFLGSIFRGATPSALTARSGRLRRADRLPARRWNAGLVVPARPVNPGGAADRPEGVGATACSVRGALIAGRVPVLAARVPPTQQDHSCHSGAHSSSARCPRWWDAVLRAPDASWAERALQCGRRPGRLPVVLVQRAFATACDMLPETVARLW